MSGDVDAVLNLRTITQVDDSGPSPSLLGGIISLNGSNGLKVVTAATTKVYDITIDSNGDILTDDFFDTSLLYSLFGERRADPSEVVEPQLRRGWIGSEEKDFENGSKLWLFEQARLTRTNLNRIEDEARKSLQWLIDDDFLVSIDEVNATVKNGNVSLEIIIRRSRSEVERRFFELWQNSGLRG